MPRTAIAQVFGYFFGGATQLSLRNTVLESRGMAHIDRFLAAGRYDPPPLDQRPYGERSPTPPRGDRSLAISPRDQARLIAIVVVVVSGVPGCTRILCQVLGTFNGGRVPAAALCWRVVAAVAERIARHIGFASKPLGRHCLRDPALSAPCRGSPCFGPRCFGSRRVSNGTAGAAPRAGTAGLGSAYGIRVGQR